MNVHIDNAIGPLVQGLQILGQLLSVVSSEQPEIFELTYIGMLISALSNLTEALIDLKMDTDYTLQSIGDAS
jgi:hypothetical protein